MFLSLLFLHRPCQPDVQKSTALGSPWTLIIKSELLPGPGSSLSGIRPPSEMSHSPSMNAFTHRNVFLVSYLMDIPHRRRLEHPPLLIGPPLLLPQGHCPVSLPQASLSYAPQDPKFLELGHSIPHLHWGPSTHKCHGGPTVFKALGGRDTLKVHPLLTPSEALNQNVHGWSLRL